VGGEWTANAVYCAARHAVFVECTPPRELPAALIAEDAAANNCTRPIDCIRLGPLQRSFWLTATASDCGGGATTPTCPCAAVPADANDRYP
jgi:hypothetical protein